MVWLFIAVAIGCGVWAGVYFGDRFRWSEGARGFTFLAVCSVSFATLYVAYDEFTRPPETPEQVRQRRIESNFSALDGSQRNLVERVKSTMHDPGSFEHVETRFYDRNDQLLVHMKFRGANAYGGKVLNEVVADTDLDGKLLSVKMIDP